MIGKSSPNSDSSNANNFSNNYLNLTNTNIAGALSFQAANYSVTEDGTYNTAVTITRTGGSSGAVAVTVTPSNNTALAPGDYNSSPVTVSFASGETAKTLIIPVVNDGVIEGSENFKLTLSNPTGGAILGLRTVSNITILDNEKTTGINQTGSTGDDSISGGNGRDTLNGISGNDTLSGDNGDDSLFGESGNDYLLGKSGNDTLIGGTGNDTYEIDVKLDRIVETSTIITEIDTVESRITYTLSANLENLTLTGSAFLAGTGNSKNNVITGNISKNTLVGNGGNDTLIGNLGNDTYVVDSASDIVIETSTISTEIDSVESRVDYTLSANVENLSLSVADCYNATGNNLNNLITGNSENNILTGGSGNDSLIGANGNDNLIGGAGNDILNSGGGFDSFTFNSPSEGIDNITDFNVLVDTILVKAASFGAGIALGEITQAQFVIGTGATTSSNRFIYNKNTGSLSFDSDGNGAAAGIKIADLTPNLALTRADIIGI